MAWYRYDGLRREFVQFTRRCKEKGSKAAWLFSQEKGIGPVSKEGLPSMNTVYAWARSKAKK